MQLPKEGIPRCGDRGRNETVGMGQIHSVGRWTADPKSKKFIRSDSDIGNGGFVPFFSPVWFPLRSNSLRRALEFALLLFIVLPCALPVRNQVVVPAGWYSIQYRDIGGLAASQDSRGFFVFLIYFYADHAGRATNRYHRHCTHAPSPHPLSVSPSVSSSSLFSAQPVSPLPSSVYSPVGNQKGSGVGRTERPRGAYNFR